MSECVIRPPSAKIRPLATIHVPSSTLRASKPFGGPQGLSHENPSRRIESSNAGCTRDGRCVTMRIRRSLESFEILARW